MDDKLQLPMGTVLQLQRLGVDQPVRYAAKLVGYFPGESVIVTTPVVNGKSILVREGQLFAVRMLQGSAVQGFATKVTQSSVKPFPHLYLEYPESIESIVVRNARRVSTEVPALARNTADEKKHDALFVDLSATGARVATRAPIAQKDDTLELTFELDVAGGTDRLKIQAQVCSVTAKDDEPPGSGRAIFYYGVRFVELNRMQSLVLHVNVLESLVDADKSAKLG